MSNQKLQVLNTNRDKLSAALKSNESVIATLAPEQQENFKKNFLEFASQEYLLSVVEPKEIIRFAVNITKIGLDIAPSSKEVYIIPYYTKINDQKVMLPQAIIPCNGMQQLAYQSGFMLIADPVYKFSETEAAAARELTRNQQSNLQTANPQWIEQHFIGFDVILKDLVGNIEEQVYFVDINYIKVATQTNKDAKWSLSTWTHKAVRKAYKQFLIPRDRALKKFEKIEELNDEQLVEVDIVSTKKLTKDTENAIASFGMSLVKKNGTAKVAGTTYGKEVTLKQLGFVVNNKVWCIEYDESAQESIPAPEKKISPSLELARYLITKGIVKNRIGEFVKDVLGTSSKDIEGIKTALADKGALDSMIETFLTETTVDNVA